MNVTVLGATGRTGRVEHGAQVSIRSTSMRRTALAVFLTDVLEGDLHLRQAPCAATATAKS